MSLLNRPRRAAASEFTHNYYDKEKRLGTQSILTIKGQESPAAPAVAPLLPRNVGGTWSAPPVVNPAIWRASHQVKLHHAKSATSSSQRQRDENKRVCEEVRNLTHKHQNTVNRRLDDRASDVSFWQQELNRRHVELAEAVEAMKTLRDRLEKQHDKFFHPLDVAKKCVEIRNERPGVENVEDEVSTALRQEVQELHRGRMVLARAYKDSRSQIRQALVCLYQLQNSVEEKGKALKVDYQAQKLTPLEPPTAIITNQEIDPSPLSVEDWRTTSVKLALQAESELDLSNQLLSLSESILTSTWRQAKEAVEHSNAALHRRVDDIKNAKKKLEEEHAELVKEESELSTSLAELLSELEAQQEPLAISQSRLEVRRNRPVNENTRDEVEAALLNEIDELEKTIDRLMTSLQRTQLKKEEVRSWRKALEHDINLKMTSLNLDDVKVMGFRTTVLIEQC